MLVFSLFKSFTPRTPYTHTHTQRACQQWVKGQEGTYPQLSLQALVWGRHLRQDCQRAEKLSTRQTQGNEFSPGSTRRLSAWMTMEFDKDKCRYHHQRHYCIRNTNCYKSLKSPVGGICISWPPLFFWGVDINSASLSVSIQEVWKKPPFLTFDQPLKISFKQRWVLVCPASEGSHRTSQPASWEGGRGVFTHPRWKKGRVNGRKWRETSLHRLSLSLLGSWKFTIPTRGLEGIWPHPLILQMRKPGTRNKGMATQRWTWGQNLGLSSPFPVLPITSWNCGVGDVRMLFPLSQATGFLSVHPILPLIYFSLCPPPQLLLHTPPPRGCWPEDWHRSNLPIPAQAPQRLPCTAALHCSWHVRKCQQKSQLLYPTAYVGSRVTWNDSTYHLLCLPQPYLPLPNHN